MLKRKLSKAISILMLIGTIVAAFTVTASAETVKIDIAQPQRLMSIANGINWSTMEANWAADLTVSESSWGNIVSWHTIPEYSFNNISAGSYTVNVDLGADASKGSDVVPAVFVVDGKVVHTVNVVRNEAWSDKQSFAIDLTAGAHTLMVRQGDIVSDTNGFLIRSVELSIAEPDKIEIVPAAKTQDADWAKLNTMYWGVKINGGGTDKATLHLTDTEGNDVAWEEKDISAFSGSSGDIAFGVALSNPEGDKLGRKMVLDVSAFIYAENKQYSAQSAPISYDELN